MSAFTNPSAAPPAAGPEPVSSAPAPSPAKPGHPWVWLILAVIVVGAVSAYLLRAKKATQNVAAQAPVKTFKVVPGPLYRTVRVAGTTSARNFANIVVPMMRGPDSGRNLTLIYLAKSGSMVKKGEMVAQMDAQAAKDHIDDVNAMIVQAEGDVRKRRADQAIEEENLAQSMRVTKSSLDKARLDSGAQEIRTSIDQELLKLAVDEAEAQYKEIQSEIGLTQVSHAAEIRILELTRDRQVRHLDRHKFDVDRFTIRAPMDGLVVMQSVVRGGDIGQIQVGDLVNPGQSFMKIVDITSMQLEATVNQVDSEELRLGQTANVDFDAFPDLHEQGKIRSIGALAIGGWRLNYYIRAVPLVIQIQAKDARVIPDLSASGDILLEEKDQALKIPLEAVFTENGKRVVYVKETDHFVPHEVKLGLRSNTKTAVLAGLSVGDEIALQHPAIVR